MLPVAVRLSVILVVSAAPVDGHPAAAVSAAVARVAGGVHAEDGGGAVLPPGARLATHWLAPRCWSARGQLHDTRTVDIYTGWISTQARYLHRLDIYTAAFHCAGAGRDKECSCR